MDGQVSSIARWRERVIDRVLFGPAAEGIDDRGPAKSVRGNTHALSGAEGPALIVSIVVAAGVIIPGWAVLLGAALAAPEWMVILGALVAMIPAYLAVAVTAGLQRTLIREVRNLMIAHAHCPH